MLYDDQDDKLGGGRIDLAAWCDKGRCDEDPATVSNYKENPDGTVIFKPQGEDKESSVKTLTEFLDTDIGKGLRSPLGGIQGGEGYLLGMPYSKDSVLSNLVESYAGTHDMLNSFIWYDSLGNSKPLTGIAKAAGETMNAANVLFATPFAMSVFLPPEVWNLIVMGIVSKR